MSEFIPILKTWGQNYHPISDRLIRLAVYFMKPCTRKRDLINHLNQYYRGSDCHDR